MKKFDFNGKTVIITGASSGIGFGLAQVLIQNYSCTVYGIARSVENLKKVREQIGDGFIPYAMDVSVKDNWDSFASFLIDKGEMPHVLINCAGYLPTFASFENTSVEEMEGVLSVNYLSCVYSCKAIMKIMGEGGLVANISSASALCPFVGVSAYSASKSALKGFTECLSHESKKITVSCVMPGFVKTDIMKNQQVNKRESGIISFFSADRDKTVKKIIRRLRKRKKRIVVGKDAHFMSVMYRLFPNLTPRLISWVIKKSNLEIFKRI